jgi:hypothetical protein
MYWAFAIFLTLVSAPYVWTIHYFWRAFECRSCQMSGEMLVIGFGLLVALPFVLGAVALLAAIAGLRGARRGFRQGRSVSSMFGCILAVAGIGLGSALFTGYIQMPDRGGGLSDLAASYERFKDGTLTAGDLKALARTKDLSRR